MLIENEINKVSEAELEHDAREVFKEDEEKVNKDLSDIKSWIQTTAHSGSTCQLTSPCEPGEGHCSFCTGLSHSRISRESE